VRHFARSGPPRTILNLPRRHCWILTSSRLGGNGACSTTTFVEQAPKLTRLQVQVVDAGRVVLQQQLHGVARHVLEGAEDILARRGRDRSWSR
jgi:hypothetical protein